MILFLLLIPIQQDESFKDNMVAVELYQKMEGESKYPRLIDRGEEQKYSGSIIQLADLPNSIVSDYVIAMRGRKDLSLKLVAYDSSLNAFKVVASNFDPQGISALLTIKEDKLILVFRYHRFGKAPVIIEPNEENRYFIYEKK